MSLAWHIVRKDLLRLRWILLLWAIVLAGSLALAAIQSGLDADTYFPFWVVTNVIVFGFLPLFAFGLVMGLLHDDPVAEIDAFWITRPISGGELLGAKALALVLFSLVPVIVTLPFWLAHDYSVVQLGLAARQTLLGQFLVVAAALPFALVSANGSKFVMHVMLGAGGLLFLSLCLQLGSPRMSAGNSSLIQSKGWLVAWIWIGTSGIVAWNQFLRRRTRWSLAAMAVAVAAGILVITAWPKPLEFLSGPSEAAAQVLIKGAPTLAARIDGEIRQVAIVGQVALQDGASASRHGVTLKVQSVLVDYTGELQLAFSAAAPEPVRGLAERLPGAGSRQSDTAHYFLFNSDDARLLPFHPEVVGGELEVASMRFIHARVRLRSADSWQPDAPPDFRAWLQHAWLIKVLATGPVPLAGGSPP